ncbi:hypothetical protein REPUB_Repub11eG0077400 [Reevesia pubescens]
MAKTHGGDAHLKEKVSEKGSVGEREGTKRESRERGRVHEKVRKKEWTVRKVYAMNVVGNLPEELWSLTFLSSLNLGLNHLTGSLPAKISNLTSMQYLSINANAFSGELPKELGMLTTLKVL